MTTTITFQSEEGPVSLTLEQLEKAVDELNPTPGRRIVFKRATEWLACKLTDAEVMAKAQEMAAHHAQSAKLANELGQIQADFKARIKKEEAEIGTLSLAVANREERRDVKCQWWLNFPRKGEKCLVRLDTGEKVRTAVMVEADYQGSLPLGETGR